MTRELRYCLLVLPVMPDSKGSGLGQRGFHLLALLAEIYSVTVFVASKASAAPCLASVALAARIEVVPVATKEGFGRLAARWFPPLVLYRPAWAAEWPEIEAGYVLPKLSGPVELCVTFRLRMHSTTEVIARAFSPERMELDLDDLESESLMSIGRFAMRRMRLRLALNCLTKSIQSFFLERTITQRYDRVFLANAADTRALKLRGGHPKFVCLPNRTAVTPQVTRPPDAAKNDGVKRLLFVGTLSYYPNEDAALWIAEHIVPALRHRLKEPFVVRIAGRHASTKLREKLANVSEIEFLGEVANLDQCYAETSVALVVVRCGGGTKIKALEAISNRTPIIATSHGMQGLELASGTDYLLADTADAIADSCVKLLKGPEQAAAMASRAYKHLAELRELTSATDDLHSLPF